MPTNEALWDLAAMSGVEDDPFIYYDPMMDRENLFKVGDLAIQNEFNDAPKRGVVVEADRGGYVGLKLGSLVYGFMDHELQAVPSHKEFTDEEYESLLV